MVIDPNLLFSPSRAIRDDNRDAFSGRDEEYQQCLNALAKKNSSLVIIGEKGVGKTSLGWKVFEALSAGKTGSAHPQLTKSLCIWIECVREMEDLSGLMLELLVPRLDATSMSQVFKSVYKDEAVLRHVEVTYNVNLFKLAGMKLKYSGDDTQSAKIDAAHDAHAPLVLQLRQLFDDILHAAKQRFKTDIVIFVDELDRLPDRRGIGTLVKSISNARFVLIGVADNVKEIITDHQSAERKIIGNVCLVPSVVCRN